MRMKNTKPIAATIKIKMEHKLKVADVIAMLIDKVGAKKVLDFIFAQCLMNTLEKTTFPGSIFANKNDEEMANVTALLYYVRKNQKQASNEGMKLLEQVVKEQRQQ